MRGVLGGIRREGEEEWTNYGRLVTMRCARCVLEFGILREKWPRGLEIFLRDWSRRIGNRKEPLS